MISTRNILFLSVMCLFVVACASTGRVQRRAEDRVFAKMKSITIPKVAFKDANVDEVIQFLQRASGVDERGQPVVRFRLESIPPEFPLQIKVTYSLESSSLFEAFVLSLRALGLRWRIDHGTVAMVFIETESIEPSKLRELIRRSRSRPVEDIAERCSGANAALPRRSL